MPELPSKYRSKETEEKWYRFWEENGFFHTEADPQKKPYCIVIPPPNITGILHMGHALNNTIQDILIRYHRMLGHCALWMPGTDHAGIATQNVVEKELAREGLKRQNLGREKFLERTWQWKEKYGNTIITQLKKLGCSCDWQRTRFTQDEAYSLSVSEVFIQLAQKGLIYKASYIINWCPRCQTALSDEEAAHKEIKGALYYLRYPLKDEPERFVTVATTRPETMLGDTAVAVNPKDRRYKKLIGKTVILPLVNEEIPIIGDSAVDPKFGTGIVKVTPAHDPNDFEIAKRHNLPAKIVMHPNASMNKNVPVEYQSMDRLEAREAILEDLQERGFLEKEVTHLHSVGHCYRCHTMVEPYLSEQWFVDMPLLGRAAEEAVTSGKIRFYPTRWKKVYLNWMHSLRGWCISRQIWWGHRIPAWYCADCRNTYKHIQKEKALASEKIDLAEAGIIISRENPQFCPRCGNTNIHQDEDVLDTWFSSWLWPFATFGWPEMDKKQEQELAYFYPTDTLVTAQEIIFFWVARMIMAGMYFLKEIPFRHVYIHGTVRDASGTKMSKSLGNIIDPLEIIEQYGCDALRFSIISLTAAGQDVFLSPQKFESGRNFANKLWNAARFIIMNLSKEKISNVDLCVFAPAITELKDKWILSRFYTTLENTSRSLDNFRFNDAAKYIYEFFWHEFCDWYIELSKKTIAEPATQIVLYKVLEKTLRVLHPIMPFITEEIWHTLPAQEGKTIMLSPWPHVQKQFIAKKAEKQMQTIISCITAVRNIRSVWQIDAAKEISVHICVNKKPVEQLLKKHQSYIKQLAKTAELHITPQLERPRGAAVAVMPEMEIFVPLEGVIDLKKEAQRLTGHLEYLQNILQKTKQKLQDTAFLTKAPKEIVAAEQEKAKQLEESIKKLEDNLAGLE